MSGTSLRLTSGTPIAGSRGSFATLRLAVADLFSLEWPPLRPDRAHVSLFLLSPCCDSPLSMNLSATPEPTACSACGRLYSYPVVALHLVQARGEWGFEDRSFSNLISDYCEPLTAAVVESEVVDLLHELMRRASGEYAWQPEGNLRGPSLMSLEKQEELCQKLLVLFGGEVATGVIA